MEKNYRRSREDFSFKVCLFISIEREKEKESMHKLGRGRETERESQAGSTLPAQSPIQGSNPRTVSS